MNRQRLEVGTTKSASIGQTDKLIGSRHPKTAGEKGRRDKAMDAVRQVVRSEGRAKKTDGVQSKGVADKAMDAVRDIVENE